MAEGCRAEQGSRVAVATLSMIDEEPKVGDGFATMLVMDFTTLCGLLSVLSLVRCWQLLCFEMQQMMCDADGQSTSYAMA